MYYSLRKGLSALALVAACSNFSTSEGCELSNCAIRNDTTTCFKFTDKCKNVKDLPNQTFAIVDSSALVKAANNFTIAGVVIGGIYPAVRLTIRKHLFRAGVIQEPSKRDQIMQKIWKRVLFSEGLACVSAFTAILGVIPSINKNIGAFLSYGLPLFTGVACVLTDVHKE